MIDPQAQDIIVARDVEKWFGSFKALDRVTLTVKKGEVLVIMGPSGSGKSTFLRTLNRLAAHDGGTIAIDGITLDRNTHNVEAVRREVGMVFQQFNLFPHLTVLENITLAPVQVRHMSEADAERLARNLLDEVHIPDQADKYPAQLSGGQQQRVAIARALAMEPKIMLFDGPPARSTPR